MVRTRRGFEAFKQVMQPAWQHTLQVRWPASRARCQAENVRQSGQFTTASLTISRSDGDGSVRATYWAPPGILANPAPRVVVIAGDKESLAPSVSANTQPADLPLALLERGLAVLVVDRYSTESPSNQFANFYSTYNRTKLQARVRDLLTVCTAASTAADPRGPRFFDVVLWGTGKAGLWALLAAPAAGAVVADCDQVDATDDQALLATDLFCPGIRNIGTFECGAVLAAPHPLLLHNTGTNLPTDAVRSAYRALGMSRQVRVVAAPLPDRQLVRWVAQHNKQALAP
jgi:hypothetical protein